LADGINHAAAKTISDHYTLAAGRDF